MFGLEQLADPPKAEPEFIQRLRAEYRLNELCRIPPFAHQVVGVHHLVTHPYAAIFDEMGAGKTKQAIDAAQIMMLQGKINRVVVVVPASVRGVWFERELGELRKHLWNNWETINHRIVEFHARKREWYWCQGELKDHVRDPQACFQWVITNYEFLRQEQRMLQVVKFMRQGKGLLILDESSAVKNWGALQTKAANHVREASARVVLLNGTPIAHSPLDMYSQSRIMHPSILGCKTFFHFRAKYAKLGGYKNRQITGWQNLEDMQERLKPYVIRRLKVDCIDLPPKLPPVTLTVPLTEDTWQLYKQMRDDLVVFIENNVSATQHAFVKAVRLAQITSGFLGGVEAADDMLAGLDLDPEDRPDWLPSPKLAGPAEGLAGPEQGSTGQGKGLPMGPFAENLKQQKVMPVGREKLDLFLGWLRLRLEENRKFKVVVFSRFRAEVERVFHELTTADEWRHLHVGKILGGQRRDEREDAIKLLDPRAAPDGPVVVVGTQDSGSLGMTLTAASTMFRLSVNYNLKVFLQGADRIHRPTQLWPCSYFDAVATGPQGQKTIDHAVLRALYSREDVATWTTSAWLTALREE